MSEIFKAACVQMRGKRDPAANLDDAVRLIREAAKAGFSPAMRLTRRKSVALSNVPSANLTR